MYGIRWDSIEVREVLTLPVQDTCSGYLFRIPAHDVGVPDLVDRCSDQGSALLVLVVYLSYALLLCSPLRSGAILLRQ